MAYINSIIEWGYCSTPRLDQSVEHKSILKLLAFISNIIYFNFY